MIKYRRVFNFIIVDRISKEKLTENYFEQPVTAVMIVSFQVSFLVFDNSDSISVNAFFNIAEALCNAIVELCTTTLGYLKYILTAAPDSLSPIH